MTNNNHVFDMIIIGGGPAGYTAALYAARAGFDTLVLERLSAGGQMALTHQIDNYPGFEDSRSYTVLKKHYLILLQEPPWGNFLMEGTPNGALSM